MRARELHEVDGRRSYLVVFDHGDEARSGLEQFAASRSISGASISGIGAFREATLGYFDPELLDYTDIAVDEQVEVLSLLGDIALNGGQPEVHAHAVLGCADGRAVGGHLQAATVWPTLEVVVDETPVHLHKKVDPVTGLALIDPTEDRDPASGP